MLEQGGSALSLVSCVPRTKSFKLLLPLFLDGNKRDNHDHSNKSIHKVVLKIKSISIKKGVIYENPIMLYFIYYY